MFHVLHDGETTWAEVEHVERMDDFSKGLLLGLLVGEGHFGGDGRQAQITLRMHSRHHSLFKWLTENVPGSRLYGPYNHGGRNYYQWMLRGEGLKNFLRILDDLPLAQIDPATYERYSKMKVNYKLV